MKFEDAKPEDNNAILRMHLMNSVKRIFISCAPEDEPLRATLEKHLAPLERSGAIVIWHTGKMLPGDESAHTTSKQLNAADVILLLVTPNYLASDSLHNEQIEPAVARQRAASARVVPVLVKPCAWRSSALEKLEPLPRNRSPVLLWPHPDEGWAEVTDGLGNLVEHLSSQLTASIVPDARSFQDITTTHNGEGAPERSRSTLSMPEEVPQETAQPVGGSAPSTTDSWQVPLTSLEGVWIDLETSSTYCIRTIEGHIRGCYCYLGDNSLVGEFYACTLAADGMRARFRWMDNLVRGYAYVRLRGPNDAIGGWWGEPYVPEHVKMDLLQLNASLPGMIPYKWIRRKFAAMPPWAEAFFSGRQWTP